MNLVYLACIVLFMVFIFGLFAWAGMPDSNPYGGRPQGEEAKEIARRLGLGPQDEAGEKDDTRRAIRRFGDSTVTIFKALYPHTNAEYACRILKDSRFRDEFWITRWNILSEAQAAGAYVSGINLDGDIKIYRASETELQFSERQLAVLNELSELSGSFSIHNNPGLNEFEISLSQDPEGNEIEVVKRLLTFF